MSVTYLAQGNSTNAIWSCKAMLPHNTTDSPPKVTREQKLQGMEKLWNLEDALHCEEILAFFYTLAVKECNFDQEEDDEAQKNCTIWMSL
ncbi:hypothetical protein QE152_g5397 [Popillia japonica]|uniref:Uncharacterized protein n=1 Tax=Popillia japonica TaxID=7064 RepID=A0AAW1MII6_POPJA